MNHFADEPRDLVVKPTLGILAVALCCNLTTVAARAQAIAGKDLHFMYRTRFFGHKVGLSGGVHERLVPGVSGAARTA